MNSETKILLVLMFMFISYISASLADVMEDFVAPGIVPELTSGSNFTKRLLRDSSLALAKVSEDIFSK